MNWKTLSLAMIFSITITGISGLILSITKTIQAYPTIFESLSKSLYDNKIAITIAEAGRSPPYILYLWMIIGIGLACIVVLTIIFYVVWVFYTKKKEHEEEYCIRKYRENGCKVTTYRIKKKNKSDKKKKEKD